MSEREVEDLLNLMPGYVNIIERDDFQSLRSPAFARGYVRAYGRLLQLDLDALLGIFDQLHSERGGAVGRSEHRPLLQLQRTGLGVFVGLLVLALVVAVLWWQGRGGVDQAWADEPIASKLEWAAIDSAGGQ